jgi:predicted DNA-binding transcriptional regulator AlpA
MTALSGSARAAGSVIMARQPGGVLQSILQLDASSRFGVEQRKGSGQAYVLVRCPGGLSIMARDVTTLNGLATAVMDARAYLLRQGGEEFRCGTDTPDAVQRRFAALGVGWCDPFEIPEPVDWSQWLSVEETMAVLQVSRQTLTNWLDKGTGPRRYHYGSRLAYRRSEVLTVRNERAAA